MGKTISGTREWSVESVNCVTGCSHNCRYCYARARAVKYVRRGPKQAEQRLKVIEDWPTMRVRSHDVGKRRKKADGRVMFPSTHDITPDPEVLGACLIVIVKLLAAGNRLLIVSKPHLQCIREICSTIDTADVGQVFRERVLFRFSIGAVDDELLDYWEPGATAFCERMAALRYAHGDGWQTSVSAEPLLDVDNVGTLFHTVKRWVTDTIVIGTMRRVRARVVPGTSEQAIRRIEAGQTDEAIRRVYEKLKDEPKVRWKESYKKKLGLELATEAGLDE